MKSFCIFTAVFLLAGICSVAAQDLIVLRNRNTIEAKVTRISPKEIEYKRFDNLDGPTIVIPSDGVLSVKYENGTTETVNTTTVIDPDKLILGINVNAGGAIFRNLYLYDLYSLRIFAVTGPGISIELGKGKFNSEINFMFPTGGFGFLATFNGFWPSRTGGAYLGGGIGYSFFEFTWDDEDDDDKKSVTGHDWALGLNVGYKFVTLSGLYLRTGAFIGYALGFKFQPPREGFNKMYFKPDLAIGWTMR